MICWSCQKSVAGDDPVFCPHCRAILPPAADANHFAVLGVPRRFSVDLAAAEGRYKELARAVHPDRHARSDARARRAAMQRTVQINEAWRALKDPYRRAEYLLSLAGIEVGGEEGTTKADGVGGKTRVPVPQTLLIEMLEKREALADARLEGDDATVATLADRERSELDAAMSRVAGLLDEGRDLDAAARELVAVRYHRRFLDEVEAFVEARVAAAEAGATSPQGAL